MKKIISILLTFILIFPSFVFPKPVQATALATGGTYTESGGYGIHTFTSSGTFTPLSALNVEVLVVAGGGGGGVWRGAGGGGGGVIYNSSYDILNTDPISVTIGSGGTGGNDSAGNNGSNSVFGTLVAVGGGGGGLGLNAGNGGSSGGSGGGAGGSDQASSQPPGNGTANQGNNGGDSNDSDSTVGLRIGGGGGGAGAVGGNASPDVGGNGGVGLDYSTEFGTGVGENGWFAGGGGGGTNDPGDTQGSGGTGGGGDALSSGNAGDALANTGGGGGGAGGGYESAYLGGDGGSGIVIIRYSLITPTFATGGIYTESGGYGIHTFKSSDTFTPASAMDVEVLVVAGGGAGGYCNDTSEVGGGGGAGGVLYESNLSLSASPYSITVGSGGIGTTTTSSNGENSIFPTLTAIGGGYGGKWGAGNAGNSGGSGGGGFSGSGAGGEGTIGQGNDGGYGYSGTGTSTCSGGGGGAGGTGESKNDNVNGGYGGIGLAYDISGTSTYYGGGGGGSDLDSSGGTGGLGGGATGVTGSNNGNSGTANTGGGGSGGVCNSTTDRAGGNGGSGIVIIRYLLVTPPTAPTIAAATVLSDTSIRWNFTDNADDETGFKVYDENNVLKVTCATAKTGTGDTYCDETGLTSNTSYTRKVVAYNDGGNSSYSSTANATTQTTSCRPSLAQTSHTITADCSFLDTIIDSANGDRVITGILGGSSTDNTSTLTIASGVLTINANQTVVAGSITISGGSITIADGGVIELDKPIWVVDYDEDGFPGNNGGYVQASSTLNVGVGTTATGIRLNSLTSTTLDCNDNDYDLTNLCSSCLVDDTPATVGSDIYGTTCKKCVDGTATNQTSSEDLFTQCTTAAAGSANSCMGPNCNGAGACAYIAAGEGSQATCKRCSGSSYDPVNIADNLQDAEGSNLCNQTCKNCDGSGSCVNQGSNEDLFNQCSSDDCDSGLCNGSGACNDGGDWTCEDCTPCIGSYCYSSTCYGGCSACAAGGADPTCIDYSVGVAPCVCYYHPTYDTCCSCQ